MLPKNVFEDRNYSSQGITSIVTTNYIVFAIAVETCVNCQRVHWFFWVFIAGLALYNYYMVRRYRDEFAEKKIRVIYIASLAGLGFLYYLLGIAANHC